MSTQSSKRRMAENQTVFRRFNEKVQKHIQEIDKIAKEDGQEPIKLDEDMPLFFYCECSDENCKERIQVSYKDYVRIHKDRRTFTIAPNHEVDEIEKVTKKESKYYVVRKFVMPHLTATLNATELDNT